MPTVKKEEVCRHWKNHTLIKTNNAKIKVLFYLFTYLTYFGCTQQLLNK